MSLSKVKNTTSQTNDTSKTSGKTATAERTETTNNGSIFENQNPPAVAQNTNNNNDDNNQQNNVFANKSDLTIKSYSINYLNKNLEETKNRMASYFNTLGIFDKAYDKTKDTLNIGITQKDVENYYENEVSKNNFLELIIENGGEIPLEDENVKELVKQLGIETQNSNSITFEEAYKALNGVEYNEDLIADVISSQDTYNTVASEYSAAVGFETLMASSSPKEALEYFNNLAQSYEGVTGEELFNNYYSKIFEKNADKLNGQDIDGLSCSNISIKDGYLWQELSYPDGYDMDLLAQSEFLYKKTDENGNEKYYKVVNLENEKEVLSNINGKDETYQLSGFANKQDDPNYNNHPLALFYKANDSILENDLYLDNVKEDFNNAYGNGEEIFDTVLNEYPKMYQEAFGTNELIEKLNAYENDMDSYSKKLSTALSIGCFAASFVPGVQLGALPLVAAASDNVIDGVNIGTSNLSSEQKLEQFKQLGLNTLAEAGMMAVGMGIGNLARSASNQFVFDRISKGSQFVINHARGVRAAVEYGIDNAASIVFDVARGITDGSLFDKNGNFDWKSLGQMALQDAIFNTADLRNGISLYNSMAGNQTIDVGDGVKFQIDSQTGVARCIYEDGHVVDFSNGKATMRFNSSDETIDLTYNQAAKSWQTQNGVNVDIQTNGISLNDVRYNIHHLNTPQEVGALADETLAGRDYRIATAGYSAPPEGYEDATKAFMQELDERLGKDNTGYVTSPTADKGSIDAITTEVAGLDDNGRLFYTTADGYIKYINPDNFPEGIDASQYASKPKTTLADASDYSRATAEASNTFLATGGRNATVSDFRNALDKGNDAVVLDNTNLTGDVWNPTKGRVENASRYIQEQVQAVIDGKPLPYPEVEGFTRSYIEANLDKIRNSVLFCTTDGSAESISAAANRAADFLTGQQQQRYNALLGRAGFSEDVINQIRAEGANNFYGQELFNQMVDESLNIIAYLQTEAEKGTQITPELIENSISRFSPEASGASMAMQLSIIGNNWTNADGVEAMKRLYGQTVNTIFI